MSGVVMQECLLHEWSNGVTVSQSGSTFAAHFGVAKHGITARDRRKHYRVMVKAFETDNLVMKSSFWSGVGV